MLTSRERLRRCFFHEPLDRPGVYCRTGYPKNDPTYRELERLLAEKTDLKVVYPATSLVEPPVVDRHDEAGSDGFGYQVATMRTPAGDLISTRRIGEEGRPGMIEKHYLSDIDDAKKFLSLPMPKIGGDVAAFFEMDRKIGDRGIVDCSISMNPAGQVADLFGSETFAFMTVTDRDVLHELCDRRMRIMLQLVDFLMDHKVGPYFSTLGQEYLTPPLHGAKDFFDFNVRYDKPILDRIHERGGRVHMHCHGSIKTVFDGFLEMGVDVLHPFEAPPMGDITAGEAKQRAGKRICLEGNVQIADMYEQTPEQMRAQVKRLIADCFADRQGLIVCPSASPWIGGAGGKCVEQFKVMVEEVCGKSE